ncbi:MAG: type II toxin-antitoxin system VapC family toxin [Pseudaminobacter sp.]|nr:type II toxin-antitoxin system VapC family toxin [Pseudaminobacter sp.]
MREFLLDTCAAIWFSEGAGFTPEAAEAFEQAAEGTSRILVSPITAWEMGLLVSRGRYSAAIDISKWLDLLVERGGFVLAGMPPRVLAQSSLLPGRIHGDPADRIIVATAREFGHVIITRDCRILAYAEKGFVKALKC